MTKQLNGRELRGPESIRCHFRRLVSRKKQNRFVTKKKREDEGRKKKKLSGRKMELEMGVDVRSECWSGFVRWFGGGVSAGWCEEDGQTRRDYGRESRGNKTCACLIDRIVERNRSMGRRMSDDCVNSMCRTFERLVVLELGSKEKWDAEEFQGWVDPCDRTWKKERGTEQRSRLFRKVFKLQIGKEQEKKIQSVMKKRQPECNF